MATNTQLSRDDWMSFFASFSNGNRGRSIGLEMLDPESGASELIKHGKLLAVDYDQVGKGDDIVVTVGIEEIEYSHTIAAPVEVWSAETESGEAAALEIIDQGGVKTILSLE
jgi:hypothetical protein